MLRPISPDEQVPDDVQSLMRSLRDSAPAPRVVPRGTLKQRMRSTTALPDLDEDDAKTA